MKPTGRRMGLCLEHEAGTVTPAKARPRSGNLDFVLNLCNGTIFIPVFIRSIGNSWTICLIE